MVVVLYQPERTWLTEPVQLELIVVGAYLNDAAPQMRLFTPWQ